MMNLFTISGLISLIVIVVAIRQGVPAAFLIAGLGILLCLVLLINDIERY